MSWCSDKWKLWRQQKISKILGTRIILRWKSWARTYEILNHVNSNHVDTDLNHNNSNHTNSNHSNLVHSNSIPSDLPNIKTKNNSADYCALQKMMSWDSKDTESSTFSTRTPMAHNYVSSIHTYYVVPAPHHTQISTYGTSDPPSTSHEKSLTVSVISTGNPIPHNNPPKPVPNVPSDPHSDSSTSGSSSLESSDSPDFGYPKQVWHTKK